MNTRDIALTFGKYKGDRIQRVRVSYLLFMVRNQTPQADAAQAELDRRGTTVPTIEISGHAIDSASLRIRKTWHEQRGESEGLHSWLCRMAKEAYDLRGDGDRVEHDGVKWVFDYDGEWPILKTVMRGKK